MTERQVSLVRPYLAAGMIPMLGELRENLWRQRVHLDLHYGDPADWAARGRDAVSVPWAPPANRRVSPAAGYATSPDLHSLDLSDLVIIDHGMVNTPLWTLLTSRRIGGSAVALWGDPRARTRRRAHRTRLTETTAMADWYFADSSRGADFAQKLLGDTVTLVSCGADFSQGILRALDRLAPREGRHRDAHPLHTLTHTE